MPTYEYQCTKGHAFDVFQRISEKPKAKCPECGAKATRVISGGAGLIFKGSGFYITDYGKDGKGPRKAEPADSGGGSAPAAETKTPVAETKTESPAPKPETKKTKPGKAASE
jgi:putative FmdB family regulatory protein